MYYPKSQIKPNLYTNGGEFILSTTKEDYKGNYYTVSNGKKYTGKNPQDKPNILLIVLFPEPSKSTPNLVKNEENEIITLGDKFFINTGGTCTDTVSGNTGERYIYINNVPDGSIPFITSSSGMSFSSFEGLIPGVLGDLEALNPFLIMQAFLTGGVPPCQSVTLEVIDANNSSSSATHFVTVVDLQNMDPCTFQNGVNPITHVKCSESFLNMREFGNINQTYLIIIAIIGFICLFIILKKLK